MLAIGTELAGRYRVTALLDASPEAPLYRVTLLTEPRTFLFAPLSFPDQQACDAALNQVQQLRHASLTGVAPIREVWADGLTCCLVCEDDGAGDLDDLLTRRPLPFHETAALALIHRLLEILVSLHDRTPPLLLGDLRASDLRLAADESLTLLPTVLIRPVGLVQNAFAAPELQQPLQEPTRSADIYAVGALLYFLLSGRRVVHPIVDLRNVRSDLSALTEPLVQRAIDERPANRYQQAREMLSAVQTVELLAGHAADRTVAVRSSPVTTLSASADALPPIIPVPAAPRVPRRLSTGCLVGIVAAVLAAAVFLCGFLVLLGYLLYSSGNPFVGTAVPWTAGPPNESLSLLRERADAYAVTADVRDDPLGPAEYAPSGDRVAVAVGSDIQLRDVTTFALQATLSGHQGDVSALSFNADGTLLATGAQDDPVIRVWRVADGSLLTELSGHEGWIRSLAFAADGRLASGGSDFTVRIWDVAAGQPLRVLTGHSDMIGQIAFAPDSRRLASVARDGTLRLWNPADGRAEILFTAPQDVAGNDPAWLTGLSWHPDGKRLAVGSVDGNIYVLSPADPREPQILRGHSGWVVIRGLSYSPDGRQLASAGLDGELRIWSADGESEATLQEQGFRLLGLSWRPDGSHIVTSSDIGGRLVVWDVAQRTLLGHAQVSQGAVTSVTHAPDDGSVLSVGVGGVLRIQDVSGTAQSRLRGVAAVHQAAAYLDAATIAVVGDEGSLGLFNLNDTAASRVLPIADGQRVTAVAADSGRGVFAVGYQSGTVELRRLTDLQVLAETAVLTAPVYALIFSDDGMQLAAAANTTTLVPQLLVWRHTAAMQPILLDGHQAAVTGLAFSHDGTILFSTSSDATLRSWMTTDGQQSTLVTADPTRGWFSDLRALADGELLAVGTAGGQLAFYRTSDLTLVRELELAAGAILAMSASTDGRQIVASTDDGALVVIATSSQ